MSRSFAASLSRKTLGVTLAAALALGTATVAPARAGNNGDALAAAAFFGLVAVAIIASSRDSAAHAPPPVVVAPRKLLPAQCRFVVDHGADRGVWYGRSCLVANFAQWPFLPDRCERNVDAPRRPRDITAYKAECLSQFGYWSDSATFGMHH